MNVPDVKMCITAHMTGTDTPETQRAKARAAAPEIVRMLLKEEEA